MDLCPDIEVDEDWSHLPFYSSDVDILACYEDSPQSEELEDEEDDLLSLGSTCSPSPPSPVRHRTTPLSPPERVEKNERERARIIKKGRALLNLKELVTETNLIEESSKKQRFTEEYTLQLTVELISRLKREISSYGQPPQAPKPLARKVSSQKVKKNPNPFLLFSQAMRPSFKRILKQYLFPRRTEAELVNLQVGQVDL